MDRRSLLGGFLALSATAAAAPAAAEAQSLRLTQAFPFLKEFYGVPAAKRDRFHLAYYAIRNRKFAPELKGTMLGPDGKRTPLVLGRDAHVDQLPTLADLKNGGTLEVDAPADVRVWFAMALEPNVPLAPKIDAKALAASIAQVEADVMGMAGMFSFVVPKITCARFPGAGAGQAELENGRTVPLPVDNNRFWGGAPFYEPASLVGARTITLARTPSSIFLAQHPR